MSAKILKARNVCKAYKGRTVVSSVNIDVHMGEIVGLLGPNGAGKTTTFYMIVGLIKPDSGRVMIDSRDITPFPMFRRARIGVGYLPQEASVFRNLTVKENIEVIFQEQGKSKKEMDMMVSHILEEFGLTNLANIPGYALSGGERRRVEIARCLSIMPDFILLDEPFSGIDPIAVYDIQQIILSLRAKGYGILLTDHNVRDTLAITDRTYLIHQGEIVIEGSPDEVAQSDVARKFYLGDRFSW
ncbi:MAG: LPS export ABC transporter ATP-binding protein [Aminobacterium sp.]|jgi:lipopolysaccharide export system ATP-binding protein|uniref:LPS export ABC transporter ATP-binding protein n=1 Tax=unclassified Aminobacterium TaxID=2685012 RepID=UPI001BCC28B6|nr:MULTISPECIES: LPS export ABC transporter ATP-binding protein [unclassified Aminobacterium]MDD2207477.1 LPS export ABC transporter ATP-binding protein [Aminobacterium sp.]MDD3427056.1 LPS export ABC transporter ATP-binding protein [Aminobacterium sp.]MDD3708107.1 LPS export ABC transporter ATP-binding protein [Aminobacterium sp.]MDD4228725.1 LPS export ABC transporter ATP-binding protein [Aminobacterium sp.]MDD4551740.1 LPS export ABC transporter ATP-binding protein [Aminobacterium sp.]